MVHALEESIRKALVLIDYAAERGISIDNRVLTAIVGAAHNTNSMPVDIEIDFWNAYQKLSVTLAPATVDSILSTRSDPELDKQKNIFRRLFAAHYSSSLAERTTAIYRTFTFITLLLLLIAQVIWVAGVTITKDVEDLTRQFTVLSQNKIKIAHEAVEEQTIIDPSVAYSSPLGVIISDIKQLGRRLARFILCGATM